jgi:hypothetical protein
MEQPIQQTAEVKLPAKTRVAAILLTCWGLFLILCLPFVFIISIIDTGEGEILSLFYFINILFFISGIFIRKKKKWAWYLAIIIYVVSNVSALATTNWINSLFSLPTPIYLIIYDIPLILLLIDRKNFWVVVNQKEKEENFFRKQEAEKTENNQEIGQNMQQAMKKKLPIKTKIVAWLIIIGGSLGIPGLFLFLIVGFPCLLSQGFSKIGCCGCYEFGDAIGYTFGGIGTLLFTFYFIPGLFLLKRRKWAWYAATFPTIGWAIWFFYQKVIYFYREGILNNYIHESWFIKDIRLALIGLALSLIPVVILIIDCKNFWKVVDVKEKEENIYQEEKIEKTENIPEDEKF